VKKLLKSVNIYGSYRKIKTGVSLFWTTLYILAETEKLQKKSKKETKIIF